MSKTRIAVGALVLIVLLLLVGANTRGADPEATAIADVLAGYLTEWNAAADIDGVFPDSAVPEQALIEMWNDTISGSLCERFAGNALGVVALMGLYNDTEQPSYLEPVLALMEQMDAVEYACLIEA